MAAYSGASGFAASASPALTEVVSKTPCTTLAGCNLSGGDLPGASLRGADLSGANLTAQAQRLAWLSVVAAVCCCLA